MCYFLDRKVPVIPSPYSLDLLSDKWFWYSMLSLDPKYDYSKKNLKKTKFYLPLTISLEHDRNLKKALKVIKSEVLKKYENPRHLFVLKDGHDWGGKDIFFYDTITECLKAIKKLRSKGKDFILQEYMELRVHKDDPIPNYIGHAYDYRVWVIGGDSKFYYARVSKGREGDIPNISRGGVIAPVMRYSELEEVSKQVYNSLVRSTRLKHFREIYGIEDYSYWYPFQKFLVEHSSVLEEVFSLKSRASTLPSMTLFV